MRRFVLLAGAAAIAAGAAVRAQTPSAAAA